ncbi:hypothetical protein [Planctomicrobium sp. SH527]|uniref:hypothetical protein n=1 Tax=Planctomicrobium sp. SH527 TaxID=3448123 RepID=UPI003F5C7C70
MTAPSQIPSYLLLFQILLPFLGTVLLASTIQHGRTQYRIAIGIQLVLLWSAVMLAITIIGKSIVGESTLIRILWSLPGATGQTYADHIAWELDPYFTGMLVLLPMVSITTSLFTISTDLRERQAIWHLLLIGTMQLFWLGADVVSCLTGAFLSAFLLAKLLIQQGGEARRFAAGLFLSIQWIGCMLMMGGFGILIATTALVQAAPYGIPKTSSTALPEIIRLLNDSIGHNPAAQELLQEYRGLPILILLIAFALMGACFPLHGWLARVIHVAPSTTRFWLIIWIKGIMLFGIRILVEIAPQVFLSLHGWTWGILLLGALFSAALIYRQTDEGKLLSAAIVWTQSLTLIAACSLTGDFPRFLVPIVICHLAGSGLLAVALTITSASQRNCIHATSWLAPVMLTVLLTLTLLPFSIGFLQSWFTIATLLEVSGVTGRLAWIVYLASNAIALAGFVQLARRLVFSTTLDPESALETTHHSAILSAEANRILSRSQICLLAFWIVIAVLSGLLVPIILMFN